MTFPRSVFVSLALVTTALAPDLSAMSVRAPTFPELVAESVTVSRARIVSVTSHSVAGRDGQRTIKTFVTFATLKPIKGEPTAEFTLAFLGGTEKGEKWTVPGMPVFAVGDEAFVFATGDDSICPLVGAMHGRYHVLRDPAGTRRYVARDNLDPLTSVDDVAVPMEPSSNARPASAKIPSALTPEDFEARILAEVKRPTRPAVQR